ncbi:hypothetical protein RRG08_056147 [Elysia crispata]|uniref:Uncharacterized protein n=1 Tax=Elysia crispata TaxID=231223 RepID=A0AAE1D497_9GAST|nr:hypothetical protein RRG08_056147 [Elysia crispata]
MRCSVPPSWKSLHSTLMVNFICLEPDELGLVRPRKATDRLRSISGWPSMTMTQSIAKCMTPLNTAAVLTQAAKDSVLVAYFLKKTGLEILSHFALPIQEEVHISFTISASTHCDVIRHHGK